MCLNEEQKKVIDAKENFLFLLAGAGSGKTRVIVEKIKKLVNEGVDPKKILAITFTRKSAQEMMERIGDFEVNIHTFHQLCLLEIKKDLKYDFNILEEQKINFTKLQCLKISLYKNSLFRIRKPFFYNAYQGALNEANLKDYDDLLLEFLKKNKKNYKIFDHIFIDEFQDTNLLQFEILKRLFHPKITIFAVGDPDQSIYSFRGSHEAIIDSFIKEFGASLYTLKINYRSYQSIISCANRLILRNKSKYSKVLTPHHSELGSVSTFLFKTQESEASFIISELKSLSKNHVKMHNIAIIYRNHFRSFYLQYLFNQENITYTTEQKRHGFVNFLSMHQSKGLEFDVVFIIGLEDQIMPSLRIHTQKALKEERRLLFVAITRAKYALYLIHVEYDPDGIRQKPSRFIKDCGIS